MARIKTVYETSMVAHLWANRHGVAIRNPGGNLSAASGRLYSYGHHYVIGAFLDQPEKGGKPLILWNAHSYSSTTNKHKSYAWRALSSTQRQGLTDVPNMSEGDISSRNLPNLALACVKAALSPFEKSHKARENRDSYIHTGAKWLQSARDIYAYAGDKKGLASVPAMPENRDKESIRALCALINKAEYLKAARDYAGRLSVDFGHAENGLASYQQWENAAPENRTGFYFRSATSVHAGFRDCVTLADRAIVEFKKAATNVPPLVRQLKSKAEKAVAALAPAVHAEAMQECRARADSTVMQLVRDIGYATHYAKRGKPGFNIFRKIGRTVEMPLTAKDFAAMYPDALERVRHESEYMRVFNRGTRLAASDRLASAIAECENRLQEYMESLKAARVGHWPFSLPQSAGVRQALALWARVAGVPDYWTEKANDIIRRSDAAEKEHAERVRLANAARIEAWRNGESVQVPRDVPVMARVKGETVQTSWGANVPLAHACRLVRLAERVARNGGQEWAHGAGPMVGHFRVVSIGADMKTTIGCHEFEAAEALKAAELIKAACLAIGDCGESEELESRAHA